MTDTSDRLAEIRARLDAAKGISPGTNLAEKFGLAVNAGYAIRDNAADDLAFLLELVDQLQREYRELAEVLGTDLAEERTLTQQLQGQLNALNADGWLLAPHHDTGGEYGLYHDCVPDEAVIGISERSLRGVLDEVREHVCEGVPGDR